MSWFASLKSTSLVYVCLSGKGAYEYYHIRRVAENSIILSPESKLNGFIGLARVYNCSFPATKSSAGSSKSLAESERIGSSTAGWQVL